ncbi:uncharacterized protein EI90DRAFT_3131179 [Cantharellus anzutake]|uniref:uncharacterized protein n=1 Tax=Cantharellus anzutake TaxID=1750568 RepID=UPI001905D20D|nr:uncharacterized protein EI90DRAFT_3131179 [Cantharellus anzutake]KAF8322333.1 hypothetical protein EI90DRAFT_3131179 [Cantharellus anzutake]
MSTSPSPCFTAFRLHDFQTPSSSGPVLTLADQTPISPDTTNEADDGTDTDEALPGDASTIKSIEAAIKKHAALYALLHSPFLSKKSIQAELSGDFHSWTAEKTFSSEDNFNQFCVHKILELRYPILTKELHTDSGAIPWLAKFVADVGAQRRHMLDCLRKSSYQWFGKDLSPSVLKSGHGPTAEERQEFLGMILGSTNPMDHLPLFLFPDSDRSHRQHVLRSQVVAAAIIVIIFGPSALNDVVSAIPLPGSPSLEDWEPAKLCASPKALGIMYNITSITPVTVAIVSMLVYFILSGDTEMVSGHGKPSRTNYLEILLNFYKFIHMVLKREETAMTHPMHETIHWFQYLLFGSSVGEEPNVLMEAGSISVGLNALLAEMDLNDSEVGPPAESPEADQVPPSAPSEMPQSVRAIAPNPESHVN